MGFKGSLETFNLADVFQNLSLNQQTGTLRIASDGGVCRNIYFSSGQIKYLDAGENRPLLQGEAFVARGIANPEQIAQAMARQSETNKPVGECLIEMGVTAREQVDELFQHQIEEEIYDLFGWEKAEFEFVEGAPGQGRFADQSGFTKSVNINISSLIMEAARRIDEWERIREKIRSPREIYAMDPAAAKLVSQGQLELDPIERRVFTLMDGIRDVDDLVADSFLSRFEVAKALYGFLHSSTIRPASQDELRVSVQECEKAGETRKCVKLYERVLALGGEDLKVRESLAEAFAALGNTDKAVIHLNVLAEAALKDGDEDKALGLLRRIVQLVPRHAAAREHLATIYAERNQKREAVIHYQELSSIYQEAGRAAEAKAACINALSIDPNHIDLRNDLIKLYLAENDRPNVCSHLEILGDQYAKAGRIKDAAQVYRRILTIDRSLSQIKTKLSNVLLSDDEKRQRRAIARGILIGIVVVLIAIGAGVALEMSNYDKYNRCLEAAQVLEQEAYDIERQTPPRYFPAAEKYRKAAETLDPAASLISPFVGLNRRAVARASGLRSKGADVEAKGFDEQKKEREIIRRKLVEIEKHKQKFEYADALRKCAEVLSSDYADADQKRSCGEAIPLMTERKRKIEEFETYLGRRVEDTIEKVAEDHRRKTAFLAENDDHPLAKKILLPLLVSIVTGEAEVYLDGKLLGVVRDRPLLVLYAPREKHLLEVRREGYRTHKLNFQTLEACDVKVAMARETTWKFAADLGAAETISAEAGFSPVDRVFFLGTSDGSVVAAQEDRREPLWRIKGSGGLQGDVIGKVQFLKINPTEKGWVIFATQKGDVYAYNLDNGTAAPAWRVTGEAAQMEAGPSVEPVQLFGGTFVVFVPRGREVVAFHATTGRKLWTSPRSDVTFTTPPFLNGTAAWVGTKDGFLVSHNASDGARATRIPTGQFAVRSRLAFDRGNLYLGNDGGQLLCLDDRMFVQARLQTGSELAAGPIVAGDTVYFGNNQGALWAVESANILNRRFTFQADGAVRWAPLVAEKKVYFGTDKGVFYCLDRARGVLLWEYVTDSRRPCVGQPISSGNRVYFAAADGTLYGFQEDDK